MGNRPRPDVWTKSEGWQMLVAKRIRAHELRVKWVMKEGLKAGEDSILNQRSQQHYLRKWHTKCRELLRHMGWGTHVTNPPEYVFYCYK